MVSETFPVHELLREDIPSTEEDLELHQDSPYVNHPFRRNSQRTSRPALELDAPQLLLDTCVLMSWLLIALGLGICLLPFQHPACGGRLLRMVTDSEDKAFILENPPVPCICQRFGGALTKLPSSYDAVELPRGAALRVWSWQILPILGL
jgi:hypothetical protein